jgi:hypothetical protein
VSRPNLFKLPLWETFEQRVLEVFSGGLSALAAKSKLPLQEAFLSRELFECCLEVNHRLRRADRGVEYILTEVTNQPLPGDEYRAKRLDKRPDFSCGFHDDTVENYRQADYLYTIECKRLGTPSPPGWVLNRNYVEHGTSRFEHPDWGYAEGTTSGMMIGFMQSMEPDDILAEVNHHVPPFPPLALPAKGWVLKGLTILTPQSFPRRIDPSPFRLNHFWIDLRLCTFFEVPSRAKTGKKEQGAGKQTRQKRPRRATKESGGG